MDAIIPLISSSVKGPLGIVHLPRLWLKISLSVVGKLAPDYKTGGPGFDDFVFDHLKLDAETTIAYVRDNRPNYLEFEAWVRENADPDSLASESVAAFNERLLTFPKPEPARSETLELLGIEDDGSLWTGVNVNDLDDWREFHRTVIVDE